MPQKIETGAILIKEGAALPKAVRLESEPYVAGWRVAKNLDGYELGLKIHQAGSTFLCHAGKVKAITFGIDEEELTRRAVKRILAKVEPGKFNCLEITRVANQWFLGVPYASVSAGSRHIQESVFLFETKELPRRDRVLLAAA